jgi:hypothetical protein
VHEYATTHATAKGTMHSSIVAKVATRWPLVMHYVSCPHVPYSGARNVINRTGQNDPMHAPRVATNRPTERSRP